MEQWLLISQGEVIVMLVITLSVISVLRPHYVCLTVCGYVFVYLCVRKTISQYNLCPAQFLFFKNIPWALKRKENMIVENVHGVLKGKENIKSKQKWEVRVPPPPRPTPSPIIIFQEHSLGSKTQRKLQNVHGIFKVKENIK